MAFDDGSFYRHMENIDKRHDEMRSEFMRLATDPCATRPKVGDEVLIAAGLLGMGYLWIRLKARVLECADTSFHVEFTERTRFITDEPVREWVHQSLITDVLAK